MAYGEDVLSAQILLIDPPIPNGQALGAEDEGVQHCTLPAACVAN